VFSTISSGAKLLRGVATDLWADLRDLLPHESPARKRVRLVLHVDSFDADLVRTHCIHWLLDFFSFLQACSRSRREAVCSGIAAFVLYVGPYVADNACGLVCVCFGARALLSVCSRAAARVSCCWALPSSVPPGSGC
jgi:hypothetical protein